MTYKKKLLFICNQAPYGSMLAKEALDSILAGSVFGQDISLLFQNEAVYQLLGKQNPSSLQQKSIEAILSAFDLYEINKIFVCRHSLTSRHIDPALLALKADIVNAEQINFLLEDQDIVLNY